MKIVFAHFEYTGLTEPDLALVDIRVDIEASLRGDGDSLPRLVDPGAVQFPGDDGLGFFGLDDDLGHGVDDEAVAPGVVGGGRVARGAAQRDVALVVHGAGLALQAPVQGAGGGVEGARVDEGEGAAARGDGGQLGEPHVVADGHGDAPVPGEVHQRQLVARRQHVALAERDLARDVDVEEVHLAVGGQQCAVGPEHERRVVVFLRPVPLLGLGDGAAHEEHLRLGGHGRQGVEGRRLVARGRRGQEGLGIRGEVVASVGRVEALGQHDEVRAGPGGLEHFVTRVREIRGLVGPAGELDAR